jgi:hypothetical protein
MTRSIHSPIRAACASAAMAGAVLMTSLTAGHAQSAYDYPWCAIYNNKSGAQACYYTSYAQCMATMEGIGGHCIESPYYRGPSRLARERYYRPY